MMGAMILIFGFSHAVAHLAKDFVILSDSTPAELNALMAKIERPHIFTETKSYTWWLFASIPGITGILILIMMAIMVLLAKKKYRKTNYERFWYTHLFWIPLMALLSLHGSKGYFDQWQFLWWIIFPLTVLVIEKLV